MSDAVMTATFYARCLSIVLDHVEMHPQTRRDQQDELDRWIEVWRQQP